MNDTRLRRVAVICVLPSSALALAAVVMYFAFFPSVAEHPVGANGEQHVPGSDDGDDEAKVLTVKVIKPKLNSATLVRSVTQPAYVQAMYKADLMTRVAGIVREVHKNIGDPIKRGEVLLEIDAPDLVQELAHRQAMLRLAKEDVKAAEANVDAVKAMARAAHATIDEKKSDVDRAAAKKRFQQASYQRVKSLADQRAVEDKLVVERQMNVEAAEADHKSSLAAVDTAGAHAEEFAAKQRQAAVEVKVKQARVEVAKAEASKAQALVDYATIRAPFDGVVVSRKVDPGAFVQNASTGKPEALLTVVRSDAVTLVMWVPERDAPLVNSQSEAVVRLDALGKQEISARVSRWSGWLDPDKSRDMRVEVDLDNKDGRLRVGMYGSMTLVLQRFDKALLLPASAVFVRGGQPYICEVIDGKAKLTKVRVQQEDGIRVKLEKLVATPGGAETIQELTGAEQVVRSGQGEVRDGQELCVTPVDW